jgi:hypothetical protein
MLQLTLVLQLGNDVFLFFNNNLQRFDLVIELELIKVAAVFKCFGALQRF